VVATDRDGNHGYHRSMGDVIAGTPSRSHHWVVGDCGAVIHTTWMGQRRRR